MPYLYIELKKKKAMKKIILTFGALLAVGLASAQSYPKQPDKTIVEYRDYSKPAKEAAQNEEAVKADEGNENNAAAKPEAGTDKQKIDKAANPAILNSNKNGVAIAEEKE